MLCTFTYKHFFLLITNSDDNSNNPIKSNHITASKAQDALRPTSGPTWRAGNWFWRLGQTGCVLLAWVNTWSSSTISSNFFFFFKKFVQYFALWCLPILLRSNEGLKHNFCQNHYIQRNFLYIWPYGSVLGALGLSTCLHKRLRLRSKAANNLIQNRECINENRNYTDLASHKI